VRKGITIVVSDRNPNVRELLKREMIEEGHRVRIARNAKEVLRCISHNEPVDILILDPNLPDASEVNILEKINRLTSSFTLIVHAFPYDFNQDDMAGKAFYVEKGEDSIEQLKKMIKLASNEK